MDIKQLPKEIDEKIMQKIIKINDFILKSKLPGNVYFTLTNIEKQIKRASRLIREVAEDGAENLYIIVMVLMENLLEIKKKAIEALNRFETLNYFNLESPASQQISENPESTATPKKIRSQETKIQPGECDENGYFYEYEIGDGDSS